MSANTLSEKSTELVASEEESEFEKICRHDRSKMNDINAKKIASEVMIVNSNIDNDIKIQNNLLQHCATEVDNSDTHKISAGSRPFVIDIKGDMRTESSQCLSMCEEARVDDDANVDVQPRSVNENSCVKTGMKTKSCNDKKESPTEFECFDEFANLKQNNGDAEQECDTSKSFCTLESVFEIIPEKHDTPRKNEIEKNSSHVECKVQFASPLAVLYEYDTVCQITSQKTTDSMDTDSIEKEKESQLTCYNEDPILPIQQSSYDSRCGLLTSNIKPCNTEKKTTDELLMYSGDFCQKQEIVKDNLELASQQIAVINSTFVSDTLIDLNYGQHIQLQQDQYHENNEKPKCDQLQLKKFKSENCEEFAKNSDCLLKVSDEEDIVKANSDSECPDSLFLTEPDTQNSTISPIASAGGIESSMKIDNDIRDLLFALVEKCCHMSLHTEIGFCAAENYKETTDIDDGKLIYLPKNTNLFSTASLELDDDLAKFSIDNSDEKLQVSTCCKGSWRDDVIDDFNTASCNIDHQVQEPRITVSAESASKDANLSILSNFQCFDAESDMQFVEIVSDKSIKSNLTGVKERELDCVYNNENTSILKLDNSIDSIHNTGKFEIENRLPPICAENSEIGDVIETTSSLKCPEISEKFILIGKSEISKLSQGMNTSLDFEIEKNELISNLINKDNNEFSPNHSDYVKKESLLAHVTQDQCITERGHMDDQRCKSTALDICSLNNSNYETVSLENAHLNGSLKINVHISESSLSENELNRADKETQDKFIKPDVLENNQNVSIHSKIETQKLEKVMPWKSQSTLEETEKCYSEQDSCNECVKLKSSQNLLEKVESENSLMPIQNGNVELNPDFNHNPDIKQIDETDNKKKEGIISALEFHSSQLFDEDTTTLETAIEIHSLKRCQDLDISSTEDYEPPCKLQKYDIIDCHLSGEHSTGTMDQTVPGEDCSGEEIDTNVNPDGDQSFYDHGLQKASDNTCFKWKYAPSYDLEAPVPMGEIEDEHSLNMLPLQTCHKPLRIGLSKKQRVQHLHPKLQFHPADQ